MFPTLLKKPLIFISISIFFLYSCDKESSPDCFKKTGEMASKTIRLDSFEYLNIYDLFDVNLIQDTVNKLVINGGKNVIPKVHINETDSSLSIENLNTCNWTRSYQEVIELQLHFTSLDDISVYGQISLNSIDTIFANYFKIIFYSKASKADLTFNSYLLNFQVWNGTGEYYLHGKTQHNWLQAGKYAYIYANDFESKFGHIQNESTGDIYVNVTDKLEAWIRSYGDIIYTGNPNILLEEESSTGTIKRQNF